MKAMGQSHLSILPLVPKSLGKFCGRTFGREGGGRLTICASSRTQAGHHKGRRASHSVTRSASGLRSHNSSSWDLFLLWSPKKLGPKLNHFAEGTHASALDLLLWRQNPGLEHMNSKTWWLPAISLFSV